MQINNKINILEVRIDNGRKLKFLGEKFYSGADYFIRANSNDNNIDYLIFLDSRGISKGFNESLVKSILECLEEKKYIAICRPLNLTTWATLYNFLSVNSICPNTIITNMGFVDFTPKKKSLLDEAIAQVEFRLGSKVTQVVFQENYRLNSGLTEKLHSIVYSRKYLQCVQEIADRSHLIVLNTPGVKSDISIPRDRPAAFFSGIELSNQFNRQITDANVLDFGGFDIEQTYDGVHYTVAGNKIIMDKLKGYL